MKLEQWQSTPVAQRVAVLRWALPLLILIVVIIYQMIFATYMHDHFGHPAHTVVEIIFYGIVGPVVAWLTLTQIGRWLAEKEEVERAVRARERYLASITEASADAILSLGIDGRIRSWNRGASLLFGHAPQTMLGEPLAKLMVADEEQTPNEQSPQEHPLDDRPRHYESVCTTQDGRRLDVDVTQTPLQDDAGRTTAFSVILRDISQHKAREAALEEERARIARDLHDGLAQSLYFIGLKLDYIRKQVDGAPNVAVQELKALKRTIQTNIRDVRRTIFALRPVDLEGLGFGPALVKYAQDFGEQAGLDADLTLEGELEWLSPTLELALFQLVREGLNNIAKHANARHAWVELTVTPERLARLSIGDDGIGFDPATLSHQNGQKMGLQQMRERVDLLRGCLDVQSVPDGGTLLRAEIPL